MKTSRRVPLQNLVIADDLVGPTAAGLKKNTIRSGRRYIVEGRLELKTRSGILGPIIIVDVTSVSHKLAKDVTAEEIARNGFSDVEDMLSGMKRYYPDFGPLSEVTVIEWA